MCILSKNLLKKCYFCLINKPPSSFGKNNYGKKRKICRDCYRVDIKEKIAYNLSKKGENNRFKIALSNLKGRIRESKKVLLNWEDIKNVYIKQNGKCAETGELFDKTGTNRSLSLCVVKIHNNKPWVPDNIKLICFKKFISNKNVDYIKRKSEEEYLISAASAEEAFNISIDKDISNFIYIPMRDPSLREQSLYGRRVKSMKNLIGFFTDMEKSHLLN